MIFPSTYPEDNYNRSEKLVYEVLSGLPKDDYDIYFQKNFSGKGINEPADYEIDFLIIDKRENRFNAAMIIEVKNGKLTFSSRENCWFQNGHKIEPGPDAQAKKNKYHFIERFRNILSNVPIGWALWFPEGYSDAGEFTPVNIRPWQIFDFSALISAKKSIEFAFNEICLQEPTRQGEHIDTYTKKLSRSLLRGLGIVQPLNILLQQYEEKFLTLESEQKTFFESLYLVDRLAVSGGAGSGKTMLAASTAMDLANEGKSVLMLCFNRMLSRALQKTNNSENIKITTFHTFAFEYIYEIEPDWYNQQDNKNSHFHEQVFPDKLRQVIDKVPPENKYDVIIIDEAQDFNEFWLAQAFRLTHEQNSKIILFFDDNQNIFERNFSIPESSTFFPVKLKYNFRNTKKICAFVRSKTGFEIVPKNTPSGIDVECVKFQSLQEMTNKLNLVIQDLISLQKLNLDDIVILVDGSVSEHPLNKINEIAGYELKPWDVNSDRDNNVLYFTSISRFKGLESNVILLILENKDDFVHNKRFYSQCTRAKSILKVFIIDQYKKFNLS